MAIDALQNIYYRTARLYKYFIFANLNANWLLGHPVYFTVFDLAAVAYQTFAGRISHTNPEKLRSDNSLSSPHFLFYYSQNPLTFFVVYRFIKNRFATFLRPKFLRTTSLKRHGGRTTFVSRIVSHFWPQNRFFSLLHLFFYFQTVL